MAATASVFGSTLEWCAEEMNGSFAPAGWTGLVDHGHPNIMNRGYLVGGFNYLEKY